MCSYIVEKAALIGSARGRKGWMRMDDDQMSLVKRKRAALIDRILAALASGEAAHAIPALALPVAAE
jgi:hypothetical protein